MARILQKTLIMFFIVFIISGVAGAASLFFSPANLSFRKDENITLGVYVNAEVPVNAVQGVVVFPTDKLNVISLNRNGDSIVNLWVKNPTFSNAGNTGNVTFEGLILNPGYAGARGKILDIVLKAKKESSASVGFGEFSILANDGKGTDVSTAGGSATLEILPARPASAAKLAATEASPQVIIVREPEASTATLAYWQVLPGWVQVSILFLVGVVALILSLIALSFGLVVIVWILSHLWKQRGKFAANLIQVEKELKSDVNYAVRELSSDIKEAQEHDSLKQVLKDYWFSLKKMVRRFFTKNL